MPDKNRHRPIVLAPHRPESKPADPDVVLRAKLEWERTFDAVPDLVAVLDGQRRIVRANRALAKRLGLPYDQIIGRPCYELLHGTDSPPEACPYSRLLQDGREHTAELYEPALGGHFLISCSPLTDEHSRLTGCVHIARDVSERKSAELTAQKQNLLLESLHKIALDLLLPRDLGELLRSIVERARGLMDSTHGWLALLEGERMVFKAGAGLLGNLPPIEAKLGQGFTGMVWAQARPLILDDYDQIPERLYLPGWEDIKALAGVPIISQGQVLGVLALGRTQDLPGFQPREIQALTRLADLASLALVNARLHESAQRELAERRRTAADLQRELMINSALARLANQLISPDLALEVLANSVLEFALGITEARQGFVGGIVPLSRDMICHARTDQMCQPCQLSNSNPQAIFSGHPGGAYPGLCGHALNTRRAFFSNDPANHPGLPGMPPGQAPWQNFLAVPVVLGQELVGEIALANSSRPFTLHDQQAVGRLGELYALALQRLRAQAERSLLEAQLRHSQKMEALGSLASGVAHDFNNILGTILGFTEIALDENRQGQTAEEDLVHVLQACQRAKDLASRLLSFSRPAHEKRELISLPPLIEETCRMLRVTLPSTIALETRSESPGLRIMADPGQIQQVLMNLCTNAAQALGDTSGRITFSLSRVNPGQGELAFLHGLQPGTYLRLEVADTGPGMDRATRERIFDPFFTTKGGRGSGLGLSVVHGIIQAHGGGIQVTSAPGQGTVFSLLLPQAAGAPAPAQPGVAVSSAAANLPRGHERIMLVDDEDSLLKVMSRLLQGLGYEVEAFADGRQALEALRARPGQFDLLLTDQTMPGITGDLLASKALALRPDLPVIICTGYSESLSSERSRQLGVARLLMKPLSRQVLAQTLRECLGGPSKSG